MTAMRLVTTWALVLGGAYAADKCPVAYRLSSDARSILTDCSGVAYRPESKTYFVIENRTGNVFEIDTKRRILNMYPTDLGGDTEGITYAGDNIFYVCGEAENGIYEIELKEEKFHSRRKVRVDVPTKPANCGLEGIAYCRPRNSLFCVKERDPTLLLEIGLEEDNFGTIKKQVKFTSVKDLAGVVYDDKSGRLLLLSQMDRCVLVVDPATFEEEGRFPAHGPQPEGICLGNEDTLCIISEPTHCLFYRREQALSTAHEKPQEPIASQPK